MTSLLSSNFLPIVQDNGSAWTKIGYAGDENPLSVFPSIVGRPKGAGIMVGMGSIRNCFVGDAAKAKRGILRLKHPVEEGMVVNWNDMEEIWTQSFECDPKMGPINAAEHTMLVTESALNPRSNREKMTSLWFETFDIPGLFIATTSVCSVVASGRSTGLSLGSGDGITQIVPVYQGHCVAHAVQRMNIAGREVEDYLAKILAERGYEMTTSAEREIVRDIKETSCYLSLEYETELERYETMGQYEREYVLPDGTKMTLDAEQFRAPEILFRPEFIGSELAGLHNLVLSSILSCDGDIQNVMFDTIILSGGSSMLNGLGERLVKEVKEIAPPKVSVDVVAPSGYSRQLSAWKGASIMACLPTFDGMWITKEDYRDAGATIVHRKCV